MNYQVLRPFSGYAAGDQLGPDDLIGEHRATQLVDQRYLAVMPPMVSGYQPSSAALLGTSIRELRVMLPDVVDVCVLESALAREERQVARQLYGKRMDELKESEESNAQPIN